MKYLTLERIKQQLRIEQDFTLEDKFLTECGEGAEASMMNILGRTFEDLVEHYGEVPSPVVRATLKLVDHDYNQRSPSSPQNQYLTPYSFDYQVKPYIKL